LNVVEKKEEKPYDIVGGEARAKSGIRKITDKEDRKGVARNIVNKERCVK
jgi:hypothetical protein